MPNRGQLLVGAVAVAPFDHHRAGLDHVDQLATITLLEHHLLIGFSTTRNGSPSTGPGADTSHAHIIPLDPPAMSSSSILLPTQPMYGGFLLPAADF